MKADFTFKTYGELLKALQRQGFCFQTVEGFMRDPLRKVVVMRHDVDLLPQNALAMARLEQELGIVSTYYFRAVPESWDEGIIREIAGLKHEVGYHYESLTTASKKMRGLEGKKVSFLAQRRPSTICRSYPRAIGSPKLHRAGGAGLS